MNNLLNNTSSCISLVLVLFEVNFLLHYLHSLLFMVRKPSYTSAALQLHFTTTCKAWHYLLRKNFLTKISGYQSGYQKQNEETYHSCKLRLFACTLSEIQSLEYAININSSCSLLYCPHGFIAGSAWRYNASLSCKRPRTMLKLHCRGRYKHSYSQQISEVIKIMHNYKEKYTPSFNKIQYFLQIVMALSRSRQSGRRHLSSAGMGRNESGERHRFCKLCHRSPSSTVNSITVEE